ncbi:CPBP family intramembrane glutamic endopeptidase [Flavobacterium sp. ENC]|uniref:CPBP family intramembrane glutamic endopeptidase n=1 Tax=Flavobacterium sp. ENC TaxID=2897330 RepID=UPI001E5495C7|nr:type II CAAX endopeptidase family protein [Flavobacterium sp. ENC]MCD0464254.1 CPBP family intramembrane metalloprotease [Flavobacterium sp. ENC]
METLTAKQKIFNFPVTKIILALIVFMAFVIIGQQIAAKLLGMTALDKDFRNLFKGIFVSALAVTSYILFFTYYEKRAVTELSSKRLAQNLIIGTLTGFGLQALTILVIYISGGFSVVAVNPVSFILIPLTVAFTIAIIEEILVRGIVFRIIEEKLGTYIALSISAVLFGALHMANPNSTLLSGLCITFAGFLLGTAFVYSRNLWFPITLHFAWNFTQSGIFGAITSGNEKTKSVLESKIQGSVLLTGGEFGPEGSIQANVFCLIGAIVLLALSHKENKIMAPYWKK